MQLPPSEGGRLECDRIILADGTAIDLFDENEDKGAREQAHKRSRERQDEVKTMKYVLFSSDKKIVLREDMCLLVLDGSPSYIVHMIAELLSVSSK